MVTYQQRDVLKQKPINNINHSLIYSIGQYRKSVTNLAIGCIRKQSHMLNNEVKEPLKIKQKIENIQNQRGQLIIKPIYGSIPTKKKRYDYGITSSSSSLLKNYQQIYQQSSINLTSKYDRQQKNIKSYSVLIRNENNYLTQPFNVEDYKSQKLQQKTHESKLNQSLKNQHTASNKNRHQQNRIKPKHYEDIQKKLQKLQQSFETITINKTNISLQKCTKTQKPFIQSNKISKLMNTKKSFNYPKTQTYTSRSDYNIEKLTNKLDSYIKKHIKNC